MMILEIYHGYIFVLWHDISTMCIFFRLQELIIEKGENEKLGMHIKGGLQGQRGNPLDRSDEGVFVSKINSIGAARRDGRLKAGMRLLEVNGKSLLGKQTILRFS